VELRTADTYFLVSRPKDADKPEVRALTHWALEEFADEPLADDETQRTLARRVSRIA
jgi:hypothetical protein